MLSPDELALLMPSPGEVQLTQTRFRAKLAESWGIDPGSRVLEVGCGQGDTTLVLMDAVGVTGSVYAVDIAAPAYGAPMTVGDSMRFLKAGPFGDRLTYEFEFDALTRDLPGKFEVAVLSLCTWYFRNLSEIEAMLQRLGELAPRICLAEWELQPASFDQFGHWLAILIQGQVEAFNPDSAANVRTPYSREELTRMLEATGWEVEHQELVDASELQDAKWEIDMATGSAVQDGFPEKLADLIRCQVDVLKRLKTEKVRPLPVYSVKARRKKVLYP